MTVCRLDNNEITGLDALTGLIAINALTGILESDLEIVLVLLLIHTCKPVIDLKLAATLAICTIKLARLFALYGATA
jgi:hypothetical protein